MRYQRDNYTAASCDLSSHSDLSSSSALDLSLLSLILCLGSAADFTELSTFCRSWLLRLILREAGVFFSGIALRDFTTLGTLTLVAVDGLPLRLVVCFWPGVVRLARLAFVFSIVSALVDASAVSFLTGMGVVLVVLVAVSIGALLFPARLAALAVDLTVTFFFFSTVFFFGLLFVTLLDAENYIEIMKKL